MKKLLVLIFVLISSIAFGQIDQMKSANFTIHSFPGKETNYVSVKHAVPNSLVKVIVYDVTGKLVFVKELYTNSAGILIIIIDPTVEYTHGPAFIGIFYENHIYYETITMPAEVLPVTLGERIQYKPW